MTRANPTLVEKMDGMLKRIFKMRGGIYVTQILTIPLHYMWAKKKKIVVFTGMHGLSYADNSRFLFEEFLDNYSGEFQLYWITQNDSLINEMEKVERLKGRFIHQYSSAGMLLLLKARCIFFSHDRSSLPIGITRKALTIQLWHGIPIKAIGGCQKNLDSKDASKYRSLYDRSYHFWVSSSNLDQNTTSRCTGLPLDRVIVTGYPRNDYLANHRDGPDPKLLEKFPFLSKKIILYAPTWRRNENARWLPFDDLSLDRLNELLERFDAYLLLRSHSVEDIFSDGRNGVLPSLGNRIITANREKFADVQELLPSVDILISDYSGIWVDYLLLNRPIILIPYDLKEYSEEQGLMYGLEDISPGQILNTFSEFIRALTEYLQNPEIDSEKRLRVLGMFHQYSDCKSYERIYNIMNNNI